MGFSFSGLSLVTAAAAELGAGVSNGARSGYPGPKPFLSTGEPAGEEEGGSTDSEPGWLLPAVCACADGKPSQLKDAPSQASLFSSLWASAVGTSEPESASAGPDSFSILTSEELPPARGTFQERPPAVLTANPEAAAADLLEVSSQAGIRMCANDADPGHLASLPDAGLLKQSLAVRSAAIADTAETTVTDAVAVPESRGAEADGGSAGLAAAPSLDPANPAGSIDLPQAPAEEAVSRLIESLPGGAGADPADHPSGLPAGSKASRPDRGLVVRGEEAADPTRHVAANDTANLFAAVTAIANGATTPSTAASGAAARPAAPHTDAFPATPPGLSAMADASASRGTPVTPQSEIAFQAEIQLNNGQNAPDGPLSNSQREAVARWSASSHWEEALANSGANRTQQPESKAPAENAATPQTVAFRRAGDSSDAGGSSHGQDHAAGNLDRGAQTTPLSHGPFVTSSKPAAEVTPLSRPPATPAAAQLDAAAPATPPETGHTVRSVALKIHSEEHGAANVVLTDRGGQVHVTVHSSDPTLAHSLRGDLGSLAGGLQQHGLDVKFFNPSSSSTMDSERGNSSEFSDQDDVRGQTRHRHSPDERDPRNRRHAEWTGEFD